VRIAYNPSHPFRFFAKFKSKNNKNEKATEGLKIIVCFFIENQTDIISSQKKLMNFLAIFYTPFTFASRLKSYVVIT